MLCRAEQSGTYLELHNAERMTTTIGLDGNEVWAKAIEGIVA